MGELWRLFVMNLRIRRAERSDTRSLFGDELIARIKAKWVDGE